MRIFLFSVPQVVRHPVSYRLHVFQHLTCFGVVQFAQSTDNTAKWISAAHNCLTSFLLISISSLSRLIRFSSRSFHNSYYKRRAQHDINNAARSTSNQVGNRTSDERDTKKYICGKLALRYCSSPFPHYCGTHFSLFIHCIVVVWHICRL